MVVTGFVAPYLLDTTTRLAVAAASLPGTQLALITSEPEDRLPAELRRRLAGRWRVDDALDPAQIADAVRGLERYLGPVQRPLAVLEQLQVRRGRDQVWPGCSHGVCASRSSRRRGGPFVGVHHRHVYDGRARRPEPDAARGAGPRL